MARQEGVDVLRLWSIVLAALAALAAGRLNAAPHESLPPNETEAAVTPDTATWLRRLPGRYIFDGVIHHVEIADFDPYRDVLNGDVRGATQILNEWTQPVIGKGDCIEFADGAPGLQCVINVFWHDMWNMQTGRASLGAVSDLTPAMVLAGVNPDNQAIRFLTVDKRGLGHPGSLVLKGEAATAKVSCVNLPGLQRCQQKLRIEARADARNKYVVLSSEVRYIRSKLDRKQSLGRIGCSEEDIECVNPFERSMEWLDELLEVSFSLRPEERPEEAGHAAPAAATADAPPPAPSSEQVP